MELSEQITDAIVEIVKEGGDRAVVIVGIMWGLGFLTTLAKLVGVVWLVRAVVSKITTMIDNISKRKHVANVPEPQEVHTWKAAVVPPDWCVVQAVDKDKAAPSVVVTSVKDGKKVEVS